MVVLLVGLCIFISNFLCFNGDCFISEPESKALASLSDVVLQANELSSVADANQRMLDSTSDVIDSKGNISNKG